MSKDYTLVDRATDSQKLFERRLRQIKKAIGRPARIERNFSDYVAWVTGEGFEIRLRPYSSFDILDDLWLISLGTYTWAWDGKTKSLKHFLGVSDLL